MEHLAENFLRDQLQGRRQKLEAVIPGSSEHAQLSSLLREVDSALERMEKGTYGICEACHDPVETERLLTDPLTCYCLDHLTETGRRELEQDLELAAMMQRSLLPQQNLRHKGWEIHHHFAPLGAVSGDYCDVMTGESGNDGLFFALGDAAGKGVAASMLMAQLHAIFRTLLSSHPPLALSTMVERAGRVFRESAMSPYFATLVCGRANASGEVELVNAGHCAPLVIRNGMVSRLEAGGLPLGLFAEGRYPTHTLKLDRGDCLFAFTDGLLEARSASGEEFGEHRVEELATRNHPLPAAKFIQNCVSALSDFRRGEQPLDDLSMMVICRNE
ncbi:MAG: SpoIIE family protein phosphatase [Deltaproteobacteria bacterium]